MSGTSGTISYRVSLAVTVPLLVLSSGATMAVRGYVRTKATINQLAERVFQEVSARAADRTRQSLSAAPPALAVLSASDAALLRGGFEGDGHTRTPLLHALLTTLDANEPLTWVSYGDANGAFSGANRLQNNVVRLHQSQIVGGRTDAYEYDVQPDGRWALAQHEEDSRYDARTRPWYRDAFEGGGVQHVWGAPYVFRHNPVPGVTCSRVHRDAAGRAVGVFTADFELPHVSRFLSTLRPSEHGQVFLYTPQGSLLAHPTLPLVNVRGESRTITRIDETRDPVLLGYQRALAAQDPIAQESGTRVFVFTAENVRYFGSAAALEMSGGLRWRVGAVAPESDFLGALHRQNQETFATAALVIALGIGLALLLASRVSKPIDALSEEMAKVGRFEVEESAPLRSIFSELDRMGSALSQMKSALASFGKFVPRDVVRAVLASGREAKLGGDLRTLTVYFSDIAGFTTLAETLDPDALVEHLGGYLDAMSSEIAAHGGTVDKFIGDGIMAFWGAPLADDEHAKKACVASLACQRRLLALERTDDGAWMKGTHTRIGLATGEVLVGNIGTPERMNYTVMGDVVNLAARLEGLNKQYGTLMMAAESTVIAAKGSVVARAIDVVAVKGKAQGIKVYELLALTEDATDADRSVSEHSERALEAYLARDFTKAIERWRAVLSLRESDPVAAAMIERAEHFLREAPPSDWDGVYVAKAK